MTINAKAFRMDGVGAFTKTDSLREDAGHRMNPRALDQSFNTSRYEAFLGPCMECARPLLCTKLYDEYLCNDCWHYARETKIQPYLVRRIDRKEHTDKHGYFYGCNGSTSTYEEALENIEIFEAEGNSKFEAIKSDGWSGDRIAHPGYLDKRRAILEDIGRA